MSRYKFLSLALLIILLTILWCGCNAESTRATTEPSTDLSVETTGTISSSTAVETIPADFQIFALDGITLALPTNFEEVPDQQWPTYYNGYSFVTVTRESFAVYPTLFDMSLDEYCDALLDTYNIDAEVRVQGGLHWFDYESNLPDRDTQANYFTVVYKTDTDFWIVTFGCDSRNTVRFRPFFFEWAKMIEFTA